MQKLIFDIEILDITDKNSKLRIGYLLESGDFRYVDFDNWDSLRSFVRDHKKNNLFIGFNNHNYDDNFLLYSLYEHQDYTFQELNELIINNSKVWLYSDLKIDLSRKSYYINTYDVRKGAGSLKYKGFKHYNKKYNDSVDFADLSYLKRDIMITKSLWEDFGIKDFNTLSELNSLLSLNYTGKWLAVKLSARWLRKNNILKNESFDNKFKKDFLNYDMEGTYNLCNLWDIKLNEGGLHYTTVKKPKMFNNVYNIDATSFYPFIYINNGLYTNTSTNILRGILETRIFYKNNKNDTKADAYKLLLNSLYGLMTYIHGFKPKHITFYAQITLLKFIEHLFKNGYITQYEDLIDINTDGIIVNLRKPINDKNILFKCFDINFNFEVSKLKSLYYKDYNNYVHVAGDKTKAKGSWVSNVSTTNCYNMIHFDELVKSYIYKGTITDLDDKYFQVMSKINNQFQYGYLLPNDYMTLENSKVILSKHINNVVLVDEIPDGYKLYIENLLKFYFFGIGASDKYYGIQVKNKRGFSKKLSDKNVLSIRYPNHIKIRANDINTNTVIIDVDSKVFNMDNFALGDYYIEDSNNGYHIVKKFDSVVNRDDFINRWIKEPKIELVYYGGKKQDITLNLGLLKRDKLKKEVVSEEDLIINRVNVDKEYLHSLLIPSDELEFGNTREVFTSKRIEQKELDSSDIEFIKTCLDDDRLDTLIVSPDNTFATVDCLRSHTKNPNTKTTITKDINDNFLVGCFACNGDDELSKISRLYNRLNSVNKYNDKLMYNLDKRGTGSGKTHDMIKDINDLSSKNIKSIVIVHTKVQAQTMYDSIEANSVIVSADAITVAISKINLYDLYEQYTCMIIISSYFEPKNTQKYKVNKDNNFFDSKFLTFLYSIMEGTALFIDEFDIVISRLTTFKFRPFKIYKHYGTNIMYDETHNCVDIIDNRLIFESDDENDYEKFEYKLAIISRSFLTYDKRLLNMEVLDDTFIFDNNLISLNSESKHVGKIAKVKLKYPNSFLSENGFYDLKNNYCYFKFKSMEDIIFNNKWYYKRFATATMPKTYNKLIKGFNIIKGKYEFNTSNFNIYLYEDNIVYNNTFKKKIDISNEEGVVRVFGSKMTYVNNTIDVFKGNKYFAKELSYLQPVRDEVLTADNKILPNQRFIGLYVFNPHARGSNLLKEHKDFFFDIYRYNPNFTFDFNYYILEDIISNKHTYDDFVFHTYKQLIGRMLRGRLDKNIHVLNNEHNTRFIYLLSTLTDNIINVYGSSDIHFLIEHESDFKLMFTPKELYELRQITKGQKKPSIRHKKIMRSSKVVNKLKLLGYKRG